MLATWMWCIENTIPAAAQCCARDSHIAARSIIPQPMPPSSRGTSALIMRAFFSASIASDGKRASRSTDSAQGAATSRAICATTFTGEDCVRSLATGVLPFRGRSAPPLQLVDGPADRGDALEDAATQHPIGELHVERALQSEHHVDARVGGH